MRNTMGWAAAALVAAGCGGSAGTASQAAQDEHRGGNAACAECKVTGGGQIFVNDHRVQFAVEAIPESGPAAGAGFNGAGVAAKGHVQLKQVPANEGGVSLWGEVDTILSCSRTDGVLAATFSGFVEGSRFTAAVTDGGEPADDMIAVLGTLSMTPVEHGNIQVHGLDLCEAPCDEGECRCPESQTCEPCDAHNTPPPVICLEGTCFSAETQRCELCQPAPVPPPPPPPPPPLPL